MHGSRTPIAIVGITLRAVSLCVCALMLSVLPAAAAAYPERVINMIVAYVPGGALTSWRACSCHTWKDRSVQVQKSSSLTAEVLGNVVDDLGSFVVHSDSTIKDLAQLAAYAKANPGALTFGTPGAGTPGHLAMTMFAKLVGAKVTHVPFKGAGDVHVALAGKHVVMGAISVGEALQSLKGGKAIRVLAQLSPGRTVLAPDVRTAKEQGYDLEMASLRGLAAPKGLPADIRNRLLKAVEQAVADPEFQAKAMQYYAPLRYLSPTQFESELRDGEVRLRQIWKESPWADK